MWDTLLDALIDSLKILPVLFLAYVLIEVIEEKTSRSIENSKFLHGKYAPLMGAATGLIPQCGFSVITTDMYTKKQINLGTLLAMYIATSDEAIPILISYPNQYLNLILILAIKFVVAVAVGYIANYIINRFSRPVVLQSSASVVDKKQTIKTPQNTQVNHNYFVGEVNAPIEPNHNGCCGHYIEDEQKSFWHFIYHPILHSLKIFAFILLVNVVFGLLIYYLGEESIAGALSSTKFFQPIIAGLIGLIPNCASSVIITRLFAIGGLSFGGVIAGLIANAGMGLAILVKQNKNKLNTFYIVLTLYLVSIITGLIMSLIL